MNRRQLFRSLIYAPLIAPLAGMLRKKRNVLVISCDGKDAIEYMRKVTEQMELTRKPPTQPLEIPPVQIYGNGKPMGILNYSDEANEALGLA